MKSDDLIIKNYPFSRLIIEDPELAQIRREYASQSERERWCAADYAYYSHLASDMFNTAIGEKTEEDGSFHGVILALAIDPKYAPSLLTVGSIEYQLGRVDECMKLLIELTDLPEDTEDIVEIIDKAGDFLIDNKDYKNTFKLYSEAARKHPQEPVYHNGLCYCHGKLKRYKKAVEEARIMVDLEPNSYYYLNDLGWSLLEAKEYDEAQSVLERAVELAPPDYELAQANLDELLKRKNKKKR